MMDEFGELDGADYRPLFWLARSNSVKSTKLGWVVYSTASMARRWAPDDREKQITLFDDGTWEYGIV